MPPLYGTHGTPHCVFLSPCCSRGRRGVFAGTVENMHLHWKYRELVKIISNDRDIANVHEAAQTLEAQSGGILVAVESTSKGHAIVMYRGKNYRRPVRLRPETLLNKRDALKRSLEAQRSESLKLHVLSLSRNMDRLKHQIALNNSHRDSIQSPDSSDCNVERDENSGYAQSNNNIPADFVNLQDNRKEVHEADAESFHTKRHVCLQSDTAGDITTTANGKLMASKCDDLSAKSVDVQSLSEFRSKTSMPIYETGCSFEESAVQQGLQVQASCVTSNYVSQVSDGGSSKFSSEASKHLPESSVRKIIEDDDADELPFKAAPLSNKERLVLRKQALKMRKRPVLAVGRSNVLSGVAKTIKTHFIKNPLAIVNIKGRASGTSVQELIFELEQATGAVLVSREPNKVILYRGWGEGEVPGGVTKEATQTIARGAHESTVSPQLIAAVQRECGLQIGQVE